MYGKTLKGKWFQLFSFTLIAILVLSACGNSNNGTSGTNEPDNASNNLSGETELEPVELTWYYGISKNQPDQATVQTAVNEYLKNNTKLNATVKLMPVEFGSYEQKMNPIVASGEKFDLMWTSNWNFKYEENAGKGAFLELDSLIDEYAPTIKSSIREDLWSDVKLNGKIYAVPNYQTATKTSGLLIQKRFIDKYNFDVSSVKTLEDLEPLLEQIAKNEKDIIPYYQSGFDGRIYDLEAVTGYSVYRAADNDFKVMDIVSTPEYKQFLELKQDWYNQGYLYKDEALVKNANELVPNGRVAVLYDYTGSPGVEAGAKKSNGGFDVVHVPLSNTIFTGFTATLNAISKTSDHPERAMMLLELVNSDSTLFNLLAYGIEDKHYNKVSDKIIAFNEEGGYSPNTGWVFGNVTKGYLIEGQDSETHNKTIEMNDSADLLKLNGFKTNPDSVKNFLANRKSVTDEFQKALESGSVDTEKILAQYVDKLEKSGSKDLITEVQKQLDAWMSEKGIK
jgi:putative aldouronate transport system substrate-binding protein